MFVPMIVTYASSAFVPVAHHAVLAARLRRPSAATPVIETLRGLLLGTPVGASGWQAVAWCGGISRRVGRAQRGRLPPPDPVSPARDRTLARRPRWSRSATLWLDGGRRSLSASA